MHDVKDHGVTAVFNFLAESIDIRMVKSRSRFRTVGFAAPVMRTIALVKFPSTNAATTATLQSVLDGS